ncbi:uncharacterized protein LOC144912690 isoform X2 [Branchiostoma floridae x Branchiostoma belcheri]
MEKGEFHSADISWLHSKLGFKVEELKPKTGGKVVKGSSIPLILPNNLKYNASTAGVEKVPGAKRTSLYVVPEASELLEGIKEPVSVLSICGPCRSGKSYILSRLLGTADAFELGHLWDSQTYGIWMGTKVLRGKNFTIVLLDTEGIDAAGASADQDASILVLTTLLSSQLIYNSLSVPYKRDLENMQCFIKLARGISVRKGGVTRISAFHEFFPDFLWLLRDVSLKMENEDGEEMDPTEYLKIRVLGRPSSDEFDDESISDKVGRAILTVFPSVECATLERPSHIARITNNITKHTDSLNPDFNKGVNALTERLLLKSRAKRSYDKGSTVSGVALSFMVNHYVEAVNDPNSIPALDNTWQNIVELMRTKAIEEVVDEYNLQMQAQVATATNNWQDPLEESPENKRRGLRRATSRASGRGGLTARNPPSQLTLMELHNELLNKVTCMLLERVGQFGISAEKRSSENEDLIDELQKRLVVREEQTVDYVAVDGTRRKEKGFVVTGGELLKYIQQNKELSKTFCQKLFERLFNQIRERVESPPEDYDFEQLLGELENTRQEYNEQARGPEKWTVLQEMTPSIEKLKVNFEKIVGYQRKILQAQQKAHEARLKAKELTREKDELLKQALDMKETQEENLKNMYRLHEQQIKEIEREMEKQAQMERERWQKELSQFKEMMKRFEQQQADFQLQLEELKKPAPPPPSYFHETVESILCRMDETDVRLLMRVWSARTGKQESPAVAAIPADWIKDMMKSDYKYTTAGNLSILEKDMMAAGISFPVIVRDIPAVSKELKYTRATVAEVGRKGGELEIPGFVKLLVPPGVLQHDTRITITTVDVAAILRDPESVNWLSGYPWSLGEDACPRELLGQMLFSPAFNVNLHGAELSGPVKVQTWLHPGSEGMRCVLLKNCDGEGWVDITSSTEYQINQHKISISLKKFCPIMTGWAPADAEISSVLQTMAGALSSRTLDCRFAAHINASPEDVQFHVVCRDRRVQTDEYHPGFTKCGGNAAMFDLFNGDVIDIAVSIREGQKLFRQMELRSNQCCDKYGQNVQMLLDRPNGNRVKGEVDVNKVQGPLKRTACQFIFKEEGDILQMRGTKRRRSESSGEDDGAGPSGVGRDTQPTSAVRGKKRRRSESRGDDGAGPSGVGRDTQPTSAVRGKKRIRPESRGDD